MSSPYRRGPLQIALPGQPRCQVCPQLPRVGMSTCWDHYRELDHMLDPRWPGDPDTGLPASIAAYWARLNPTPTAAGLQTRRAPGFHSSPPLSLHAVAMRDERSRSWPVVEVWYPSRPDGTEDLDRPIHEQLGEPRPVQRELRSLAEALAEDLDVPAPPQTGLAYVAGPGGVDVPGRRAPGADVAATSRWLWFHRDDIAAHPDFDDLWRDLTELRDQLRDATGDPVPRPVGKCRGLITIVGRDEHLPCLAPLYLPVARPGGLTAATDPVLRCDYCCRRYRYLDLLRLQLDRTRDRAS